MFVSMISSKFEYAMLFFFFFFFSKNCMSWLLPYLSGIVPQSYLRGCLPGYSPQQSVLIKLNSQFVLFYSATSFGDQLGDPEQTSLLHLNSTRTQNFGASRCLLSPPASLVGPNVFEKVSPGYQISHYGVKLFTGEQSSLNLVRFKERYLVYLQFCSSERH